MRIPSKWFKENKTDMWFPPLVQALIDAEWSVVAVSHQHSLLTIDQSYFSENSKVRWHDVVL